MADDDKARRVNEDEMDEVEAHHGKKSNLANEEAKDEAAGDDDFEAHRKPANV
jgi:hypothetical protein